jgi:hypothetical protein
MCCGSSHSRGRVPGGSYSPQRGSGSLGLGQLVAVRRGAETREAAPRMREDVHTSGPSRKLARAA